MARNLLMSPGMTRRLLVLVLLAVAAGVPATGARAADAPLATAETLVGAWNGRWATAAPAGHGSAELVLSRVPGRDNVVGQFTFVIGGVTRSLRYEGEIDRGRVSFPLVGEGRIVLEPVDAMRPGTAARLRGEWTDTRGALPAPRGMLELTRGG
jgi:hypothetical protein